MTKSTIELPPGVEDEAPAITTDTQAEESDKKGPPNYLELRVKWNPQNHAIAVEYNQEHIKNLNFVLAILNMARIETEYQLQMAVNAALAKRQMEAMQAQAMQAQLANGGLRVKH